MTLQQRIAALITSIGADVKALYDAIAGIIPDQSGQNGKYLTTNGTTTSWDTPSASVADGDKGDITVSGPTWTIDNNAVSTAKVADDAITYAKMQNVATNQRLLGCGSGAGGSVQELTQSATLDWIGSTRGSVLYRGSSGWAVLTPGSAGTTFISKGSGADPTWELSHRVYPSVSTNVTASGTNQGNALALSTAYGNFIIMGTVASGTGVKLPPPTSSGLWITIKNNGANTLNIYPNTGHTINALSANTAITLAAGSCMMFISTNSSAYQTISLP